MIGAFKMDFDQIVVKESPGLCRCCLSEGCYKDLGTEYPWMDDTEIYADMLLECFDISISQHNEGPNGRKRLICEVCITRLRDACNFKKQVLESEKKFVDMVGRGEFRPKASPVMYENPMKCEVNIDDLGDHEEVEFLEEDEFDDASLKDETQSSAMEVTAEPLPTKSKRGRPKKSSTEKSEKKSKVPKLEEKPKTSKALSKDEVAHTKYEHYTSEKRRKNLKMLFDNTSILPFKWRGKYLCFHCDLCTADYRDFKKHTRSHGPCSTQDYSLRLIKGSYNEVKIDISDITCELCNEQYTSLDDIINHLIEEHGLEYDKSIDISYEEYYLADLHCQYCGEQFEYFRFLSTHIKTFHPKNTFMCDDCGLTFNKKRDMTDHIRRNHRKGGYPCDECSEVFDAQSLLRKHKNDFHFRKCKTCRSSFASLTLLRKHVQLEHSVTGIKKCPHCAREFQTRLGMIQHLRNCKVKVVVKKEKPATFPRKVVLIPRKTQNILQIRQNILCVLNMSTAIPFKFFSKFSCFYCSIKFTEFEELKEHTALQHPVCDLKSKSITKCKGERTCVKIDVTTLACKVCGRPMDSLDTLIDHLISRHRANYDTSFTECFEPFKIVKDNIPCPHCLKIFRYFATLIRHINAEHSSNRKICDFCGRCFKNAANLKVHIGYSHLGACECDICGLKFKNVWCLGRHNAKNHDVKDFKCPKCPELFQSQYHKQKHLIQVHDIGHKCSYCDRMFTRNSFMKDHIRRTHLKEKNVPCSVCNEKFFDNHLLKLHMVKHDGERKFSCHVCGKAFLRRSNLCSHMDMHKKYGHVQSQI